MFSRALENMSPWTDAGMFENVSGCIFRDGGSDTTMYATVRSLLSRRLPDGESFAVKLINLPDSGDVINDPITMIDGSVALNISDGVTRTSIDDLHNMIVILQYRYTGMDDAAAKLIESVDQRIGDAHPEWENVDKTNTFLNQFMKIRVLISKERNAAVLITERLSMSMWHLIQSIIPTYVPELFKDVPLDPKEKRMLKTMTARSSSNYTRELSELEEFYDIRGKKIAAMIGGFEKRERQNQIQRIDQEITNIRNQMADLMRSYRQKTEALDDANIRRNGMVYAIDNSDDDSGLIGFFQANKMLDVMEVNGSRITFVVRTAYENFDQDAYETYRENERFLDETAVRGVFERVEDRKRFMDAMFIDMKFKVLLCAVYHLDIRGHFDTTSGYMYPPNCGDYIPNYHLDHHHCLGNYMRVVTDYLQRGDTIGAINACIASAKSININESGATFIPFMKQVFTTSKKCILLPNGEHVTPAKALELLKEEEGATAHEAD